MEEKLKNRRKDGGSEKEGIEGERQTKSATYIYIYIHIERIKE